MSDTLTIPSGASFEASAEGVVLSYDGNVALAGTPDTAVAGIRSGGDVSLADGVSVSWVEAGGNVTLGAGAGAARVQAGGDLSLGDGAYGEDLQAGGDLVAAGAITCTRLSAGGAVSAGGLLTATVVEAGSLDASAGAVLQHVNVRGDASVAGEVKLGDATATGAFTIGSGTADVDTVRAARVVVEADELKARGLQGGESVSIGATRLSVDAVIAPSVQVGPETKGRAAVIESTEDLGPNAIKGGFSLSDFADFSGVDAGEYLASRHLVPLGADLAAPPAPDAGPAAAEPEPEPEPAAPEPEPAEPEPEPAAEPEPEELDDADLDELDVLDELEEIEDLEEVEAAPPGLEPELHQKLVDVLGRMEGCYDDEQPAAIGELRGLITAGDVDALRGDIARIWKDLLAFHQQRSMRIPHRVTNTFNTLNSIVRKA